MWGRNTGGGDEDAGSGDGCVNCGGNDRIAS